MYITRSNIKILSKINAIYILRFEIAISIPQVTREISTPTRKFHISKFVHHFPSATAASLICTQNKGLI